MRKHSSRSNRNWVVILLFYYLFGCWNLINPVEATIIPTRFPTTKAPTFPPHKCSDECFIGYLTNSRCDPDCDVPTCFYDNGECDHAPCEPQAWIECMNSTYNDHYSIERDAFFNQSKTAQEFYCNDTVNYYNGLANCTSHYQCWPLFDDFMSAFGYQFEFQPCEKPKAVNSIIFEDVCEEEITCESLLPGAPTPAPVTPTLRPTGLEKDPLVPDEVIGAIGGAVAGVFIISSLTIGYYMFCTKDGLQRRLRSKEATLDTIEASITKLESMDAKKVNTVFSNSSIREVQLERLQERGMRLESEIQEIKNRLYGDKASANHAIDETALGLPNESAKPEGQT